MAQGHQFALSARDLPALLARVHDALTAHRDNIDALNVFPVPDGDTGTNMTLTIRAALDAMKRADPADAHAVAAAVVRGAIRGARGNSGVILSQVVRAVVDGLEGAKEVGADRYADALGRARDLAYEAVAEPVEGTILTAIAAAADTAREAVAEGQDLVSMSAAVCAATAAAVERTPEQLDVLRHAGVVDAGARGFEVVLGAVHGLLTGENPPVAVDRPARHHLGCDAGHDDGYRFEVQYLLEAPDAAAEDLRHRLELLGGSVAVVGAGDLLNVHVHTDDVGGAIEEGVTVGTPSDIEVVDLRAQVAERAAAMSRRRGVGAVAVLAGPGLVKLAEQSGAVCVSGVAGALPSVADLLNACGDVDADRIVLLPGHANAVPTARQASEVSIAEGGRELTVVEAADNPPSVLAALAVCDGDGEPEAVVSAMTDAAGNVHAGEIVAAVRDATSPVGPIRKGQPLVVIDGRVTAVCDDSITAVRQTVETMDLESAELVTLLVGADVDEQERDEVVAILHAATAADVEVVDGGQRPSRYWIGVE